MKNDKSLLGFQHKNDCSLSHMQTVGIGQELSVRVLRPVKKGKSMKKTNSDELRPEYRRGDLGPGVRGKYFESYRKGTNLVLLSPDVAKAFPTENAVNDALRSLIEIARKTTGLTRSTGRTKKLRAG
jgi:hypothetical protein